MNKETFLRIVLLFDLINGQFQINIYLTGLVSNNSDLQHDCLRAAAPTDHNSSQIISYCMGEWSSEWKIQENNFDPKFNFSELSKKNISSEQLYHWSAPMDLIEKYQFYLDQLKNSKEKSNLTISEVFYNCTLPNFGPKCEFMLNDYHSHYLSLNELIHDYYCWNQYYPSLFTCYMHLECNQGIPPSCLDWSEICDGKVDCLHGEDEKHCWQLEIHSCNEDEYRCFNGQCIPNEFYRDRDFVYDCLDRSDEYQRNIIEYLDLNQININCFMPEPNFSNEDATCAFSPVGVIKALTSSCVITRPFLLFATIFSVKPNSISDECWTAFKCIIGTSIPMDPLCRVLCSNEICDKIVNMTCPDMINASSVPILLNHIFFVYKKTDLKYGFYQVPQSIFVCYNNQLFNFFDEKETQSVSNNIICRPYDNLITVTGSLEYFWTFQYIGYLANLLQKHAFWISNNSIICNTTTMYQCVSSSKCISKGRLFNSFYDCLYGDDEMLSIWDKNCSIKQNSKYFKCEKTNECIPLPFVNDNKCDCTEYTTIFDGRFCDDEVPYYYSEKTTIKFETICDNFTNLYALMIDDEYETDETECDQWICNNIYTRCDGHWNCLNGEDELNCDLFPILNCSSNNNHICLAIKTQKPICLPIEKANDGQIDCVGAADEPILCRSNESQHPAETFYCKSSVSSSCIHFVYLCDRISHCINNEDELTCTNDDLNRHKMENGICGTNYASNGSHIAKTLCKSFFPSIIRYGKHFKLDQIETLSKVNRISPRQSEIRTIQYYQQRCHRGLDIKNMVK